MQPYIRRRELSDYRMLLTDPAYWPLNMNSRAVNTTFRLAVLFCVASVACWIGAAISVWYTWR